jgi:tripartite-type tricarboxylate transporter receptor subunit TctC
MRFGHGFFAARRCVGWAAAHHGATTERRVRGQAIDSNDGVKDRSDPMIATPSARIALLAGLAVTMLAPAAAAVAQDWPARPVKILIPFTAGGTADMLGRLAAQKLSDAFGQQFVPENKPGASGMIAAGEAAKAAPDGHTLFVSGVGGLIIASAITPHPPADPVTGYTHIAFFGGPPAVLLVNNDVPAKTLKELIAHAKANPGKINYGSPSPGSQANLAFMLLAKETGIALQHVAYRGASQAMTDLIGGHIAVTSTALTSAAGTIRGGKVRALGVTSRARVADYPEIPTFVEQGFPNIVAVVWFALSGPKGIPADIVGKLNAAVVKGFREPDAQARLKQDAIVAEPYDPAAFAAFYRAENAKWGPLAKEVLGTEKK